MEFSYTNSIQKLISPSYPTVHLHMSGDRHMHLYTLPTLIETKKAKGESEAEKEESSNKLLFNIVIWGCLCP